MRFLKYILFLFSSLLVRGTGFASAKNEVGNIYAHLSKIERVDQLVWIKSQEKAGLSHKLYSFGGVYFDNPLSEESFFDGVAIAVQLDTRINPLPSKMTRFPYLLTLASITQSDIFSTYFYFLRSNCKA